MTPRLKHTLSPISRKGERPSQSRGRSRMWRRVDGGGTEEKPAPPQAGNQLPHCSQPQNVLDGGYSHRSSKVNFVPYLFFGVVKRTGLPPGFLISNSGQVLNDSEAGTQNSLAGSWDARL